MFTPSLNLPTAPLGSSDAVVQQQNRSCYRGTVFTDNNKKQSKTIKLQTKNESNLRSSNSARELIHPNERKAPKISSKPSV